MVTPKWVGSPNFTPQNGVPKTFIVDHWMAGNLRGTDAIFNRPSSFASAHYGVENAVAHQYVAEKDYSWANGNTYANRHSITIEHAGGWKLPDGSLMKPTRLTHETSAQIHAAIARRWGMGRLAVGVNVFPHHHFVATMCPGTLDLRLIVELANEINYPTPKKRRKSMTTRYVQIGTGGKGFGKGALCALAGDVGYPCPGNFDEYVRTVADGGVNDRAANEFLVHGPGVPIPKSEWAALRKRYTEGGPAALPESGASKADVDAAAERVIQKIPTKVTATLI